MKNLHSLGFSIALFCFICFVGCTVQELPLSEQKSIDFIPLVESYNASRSLSQHEGVILKGAIWIEHVIREGEHLHVFQVVGHDALRKYQFQYLPGEEPLALPEFMPKGEAVYLGDHLIINDLTTNESYFFMVQGYDPRIPGIQPLQGTGLLSAVFDTVEALMQASGPCSCECKRCWPSCEQNCGAGSASCSCGGSSQSVTCRPCYNATCTQCAEQ